MKNEKYNQRLQQMQQKMTIAVNGSNLSNKHISQADRKLEAEIAIQAQVAAIQEYESLLFPDIPANYIDLWLIENGYIPEN